MIDPIVMYQFALIIPMDGISHLGNRIEMKSAKTGDNICRLMNIKYCIVGWVGVWFHLGSDSNKLGIVLMVCLALS